ncbi:MAG: SGNH/GDSL hydrolase family protein [Limnohabitans sp.]
MHPINRWGWRASLTLLVAVGLTACGGNDPLPPKASISKVFVMGDSLADVGTFGGLKFTVMDPVNPRNSLVWPQLIANQFGLDGAAQCNFYSIGAAVSTNSSCTNYAIGGARIVNKATDTLPTVGAQLATRALAPYSAGDLLLVDGGGNDAADLAGAFLGAAQGNVSGFQAFLLQQLDAGTLAALLTQDPTGATAAGAYMQALALTYYEAIKTQALDKGAARVAVLNLPDITVTPRFQAVIAALGATQGAQVQALIRAWITAFNVRLKALVGQDTRIALVDFYADFQDEVANPASYSLSDVRTPACSAVKSETFGNFPCLTTELDAQPGKSAGWWKSYAFSDGFHPTPYGHQLLAASVSRALARAGWL